MNTLLKRKLLNFSIFTFGTYLLECVSFAFMGFGFFPIYFFLDLLIIALFGAVIFIFKNTLFDMIYLPILMLVATFLFCLNANYYVATGAIFAFQDFQYFFRADKVIGAITGFINVPIVATECSIFVALIFAILFINIKFKIKLTKKKKKNKKVLIGAIASVLCLGLIYPGALSLTSSYERNAKNNKLIDCVNLAKNYNYHRLGTFSYYVKDIFSTLFSNNLMSVNELKNYCINTKTEKNEFTGLLSGYNVITVMVETGARIMLNETLTPNLWNLTQNGVDCSHSYAKNKTDVSEYIGITGNYTSNGIDQTNFNNKIPFALPNILQNYHSVYFHDVGTTNDFYTRRPFIPKLGFKETCFHEYLYPGEPEWDWNWYTFDSVTSERVVNKLKTLADPYYVFYTTLTMHGSYYDREGDRDYVGKLNEWYLPTLKQAEADGKWTNPLAGTDSAKFIERFMLKVMDFDRGLGHLVKYLNDSGKFNNTLLVLYGDHDIYYPGANNVPLSQLIYKKDNRDEIALYNTMLTLYTPKLNEKYYDMYRKHTYDHFTSTFNIVPTILDLLGEKYNESFYLDKSIFNLKNSVNLFYSFEISDYMNENYLTQSGSSIDKIFNDNNTKNEFLEAYKALVTKMLYINYIYSNDIFKNHNYNDFFPANKNENSLINNAF